MALSGGGYVCTMCKSSLSALGQEESVVIHSSLLPPTVHMLACTPCSTPLFRCGYMLVLLVSIFSIRSRNYDILGRFNGCYSRLTHLSGLSPRRHRPSPATPAPDKSEN